MANPSIWDLLVLIEAGTPDTLGQATSANSVPVVIASDQSAIPISGTVSIGSGPFAVTQSGTWNINNISGTVSLPTGAATESTLSSLLGKFASSTSTLSNVAASASSVTVLASNSSRKSAILYNDSTVTCYVKFGSTASATSFTYLLTAGSTLIIDDSPVYTGIITGIWASATGNMRVTELT